MFWAVWFLPFAVDEKEAKIFRQPRRRGLRYILRKRNYEALIRVLRKIAVWLRYSRIGRLLSVFFFVSVWLYLAMERLRFTCRL